MTTIRAAVEALKASREALSPYEVRWAAVGTNVLTGTAASDGIGDIVARCRTHDHEYDPAYARHIALVASPHVVQALEELLGSVEAALVWIEATPGRSGVASILAQRTDALCRAITRRTS